ncbi:IS3 family transposase [Microbacterium sp.]|uniref:IS3 family transposase n=1 Tax=Microbacterium sp. TaxID=51671 RepID=UPI003524018A
MSTQGYYKWLKDPVCQRDWDDAHLIDVLYDLHADDATLGYRFLTDELDLEHGITVGENRVHRLCRIAGITASHHKKRSKAGSTGPAPHDDLLAVVDEHGVVRHEFVADEPNKVWLWDLQCRRRHWMSYADLRTMPTFLATGCGGAALAADGRHSQRAVSQARMSGSGR